MGTLFKFAGFLPAENDGSSTAALYRVDLLPPAAEACKPQHQCIVLLVDTSGSMDSQMSNLKKAISSTVDIILERKIASLDQIVLVPFSTHSKVHRDFKEYHNFDSIVSELSANGGTNYCFAIDELTKLLDQRQEVVAVMFSDGEPTDYDYPQSIEKLRAVANDKSLLFHSIGLQVCGPAERILRNLTTVGWEEGFYQSIDDTEITASMNVLVDHFNCAAEPFVNGSRTRKGFVVSTETEHFVAQVDGEGIALEVVTRSFDEMLEENSFEAILDAFHFLLEYHLRSDEGATFERATAIVTSISCLLGETDNRVKSIQQEKLVAYSNEKAAKMNSMGPETGANRLKRQSEIISELNKNILKVSREYSPLLRNIQELKKLCTRIQESLHIKHNISTSISGEILNLVNQFRDNSIAQKRKHIARLSSKVQQANDKFRNIDKLLQEELDQLVKLESIPVPQYFENYSDPITLNSFEEVMMTKYGVFMLLINVERHDYGIAAPHKTKIIEVGGFSSSVLDVMDKNEGTSVIFDLRGIGFGNAAVPMWISDLHWRKARHLFGPFVGHAVTGNELEYTRLQGMTLLALILIHLRQLESTEYHQQLIRMVYETLGVVIDKAKWQEVADKMCNSFDRLNESVIPSVEVFLVFHEFLNAEFPLEKGLLLLAEQYRRVNAKRVKEASVRSTRLASARGSLVLNSLFPNIFVHYLGRTMEDTSKIYADKSIESYFLNLFDSQNKEDRLLKWFESFSKELGPSLRKLASGLEDKQKMAIVLSSHKCTILKWDSLDEVPAGLSYDSAYPDVLLCWCSRNAGGKQHNMVAAGNEKEVLQQIVPAGNEEAVLLEILQAEDETKVKTLLRGIKRNSHSWGVMLKVLLPSIKTRRGCKVTDVQWQQYHAEFYQKLIEDLSIPLHLQLIMFCIFESLKPEDWVSTKMIWRPNPILRRRIRTMFPGAPEIE